MSIPLVFKGKFTEKYFKKFHLPKIQFRLLDGRFMDFLPIHSKQSSVLRNRPPSTSTPPSVPPFLCTLLLPLHWSSLLPKTVAAISVRPWPRPSPLLGNPPSIHSLVIPISGLQTGFSVCSSFEFCGIQFAGEVVWIVKKEFARINRCPGIYLLCLSLVSVVCKIAKIEIFLNFEFFFALFCVIRHLTACSFTCLCSEWLVESECYKLSRINVGLARQSW